MSIETRVPPDKTWGFYIENRQKLRNKMLLLASSTEVSNGIVTSIYMTEEDGFPQFVVFIDNDPVCVIETCNAKQCEQEAKELYNQYIYDGGGDGDHDDILNAFSTSVKTMITDEDDDDEDDTSPIESDEEIENQRIITDGEDNLDQAFGVLLEAIAEDDYYKRPDADKIGDDIKELVCEYLYRKYGISVYRPMYLEDEDGKEFFVEHPYEHMVFDDPDNPLYKKS